MSVTATGLAKYQAGLQLEKEGLSGEEIAKRLGYKDAQSWWTSKASYTRRAKAFAERCQPRTAEQDGPAPILEGLPDRIKVNASGAVSSSLTVGPVKFETSATAVPAPEDIARQLLEANRAALDMRKKQSKKPKAKSKPPAEKEARAVRPPRTSADGPAEQDAYQVPEKAEAASPLPWEGPARLKALKMVSTSVRGEIGWYTFHRDADKIIIDVLEQKEETRFSLTREQLQAFMAELFDLTALMEVG